MWQSIGIKSIIKKYKINFRTFEVTLVMRVLDHLFLFFGIGRSNTHAQKEKEKEKDRYTREARNKACHLPLRCTKTPKTSLRASILSMVLLSRGSHSNIYHKIGKMQAAQAQHGQLRSFHSRRTCLLSVQGCVCMDWFWVHLFI